MPQLIRPLPTGEPWGIEPSFAGRIQNIQAYSGQSEYQHLRSVNRNGVDVLEIRGVLTKYPSEAQLFFGGAAITEIQPIFTQSINGAASAVVFVIDSPGGEVSGVPGMADAIFEAKKTGKRTIAQVDGLCASAAYYLASQCDEIYCTHETDRVGAIGAIRVLTDSSKNAESNGIEVVVFESGKMKSLGVPGAPITPEHRAYLQQTVDAVYADFSKAVQRGRKLSATQVTALSDGKVWTANEAKSKGLIDGIQSLDKTLAMLNGSKTSAKTTTSGSYATTHASAELPAKKVRVDWKGIFDGLVAEAKATGLPAEKAVAKVVRENDLIHQRMLAFCREEQGMIPAGGTSTPDYTATSGTPAKDAFDAEVSRLEKTGLNRIQAISQMEKTAPHFRAALLAESKANR